MYAAPLPATLAAIQQHCQTHINASTPTTPLGYTTHPVNYVAPVFRYSVVPPSVNPHWQWQISLEADCSPGTLTSRYIQAGQYDTGVSFNGRNIWIDVPAPIAQMSLVAETEHVDDHWNAYTKTLLRAKQLIEAFQGPYQDLDTLPGANHEAAMKALVRRLKVYFNPLGYTPNHFTNKFLQLTAKRVSVTIMGGRFSVQRGLPSSR